MQDGLFLYDMTCIDVDMIPEWKHENGESILKFIVYRQEDHPNRSISQYAYRDCMGVGNAFDKSAEVSMILSVQLTSYMKGGVYNG